DVGRTGPALFGGALLAAAEPLAISVSSKPSVEARREPNSRAASRANLAFMTASPWIMPRLDKAASSRRIREPNFAKSDFSHTWSRLRGVSDCLGNLIL